MGDECIRCKKRLGREVRRIALDRMGALEQRFSSPACIEALVHDTRTGMKRVRAMLYLVRSGIRPELFRRYQRTCKGVADALAQSRDQQVIFNTLELLLQDEPDRERRARLCKPLRHRYGVSAQLVDGSTLSGARERLSEARISASHWKLKRCDAAVLRAGLYETFRGGQKAWRQARKQPEARVLHRWRMRVKRFYYQLTLLFPDAYGGQRDRLKQLGEALGELNDLTMLEQFVGQQRQVFWIDDIVWLAQRVQRQRQALLAEVWCLSRQVYRRDARSYVRRLVRRWSEGAG